MSEVQSSPHQQRTFETKLNASLPSSLTRMLQSIVLNFITAFSAMSLERCCSPKSLVSMKSAAGLLTSLLAQPRPFAIQKNDALQTTAKPGMAVLRSTCSESVRSVLFARQVQESLFWGWESLDEPTYHGLRRLLHFSAIRQEWTPSRKKQTQTNPVCSVNMKNVHGNVSKKENWTFEKCVLRAYHNTQDNVKALVTRATDSAPQWGYTHIFSSDSSQRLSCLGVHTVWAAGLFPMAVQRTHAATTLRRWLTRRHLFPFPTTRLLAQDSTSRHANRCKASHRRALTKTTSCFSDFTFDHGHAAHSPDQITPIAQFLFEVHVQPLVGYQHCDPLADGWRGQGLRSRPSKDTPSPSPSLLLPPRHTTTRPNNTPYTTRHSSTPPLHAPLHSTPTVLISPTQPTHPTHSSPSHSSAVLSQKWPSQHAVRWTRTARKTDGEIFTWSARAKSPQSGVGSPALHSDGLTHCRRWHSAGLRTISAPVVQNAANTARDRQRLAASIRSAPVRWGWTTIHGRHWSQIGPRVLKTVVNTIAAPSLPWRAPWCVSLKRSPRSTVAAGALRSQVFPRRRSGWDTTKSKYWIWCAGPNGMHRSATAGRVGRSSRFLLGPSGGRWGP